jgi:translation elongation factor aEF-1 beta
MGTVSVRMKIMPESPLSNLKEIENKAKMLMENHGGINPHFAEEPIAFGLKAIIASFEWPEEKELDEIEAKIGQIADVKSAEITDIRRAIG